MTRHQQQQNRQQQNRRGVAAVEFALVVPIFLLLVFGIIEFGRVIMVQQVLVNASREGARRAVLETATADSVTKTVSEYLKAASVKVDKGDISVSPDPSSVTNHRPITVSVSVNFSDVSWMPPFLYQGNLEAATTMRSEKLE
jgi:Flp pilus assembly protein TadG